MGATEIEPIVETLVGESGGAGASTGVHANQLRLFELKEGLPTLLKISLTFAAIGMIALVTAFIDFLQAVLSRTVGRVPGVGGAINNALRYAQRTFTNRIGALYSGVDHEIGHSFFQLARLGRLVGKVALSTAFAVAAIVETLKRFALQQPLAPVVGKVVKQAKGTVTRVTIVERKVVQVTKLVARRGAVIPLRRVHALEVQVKQLRAQEAKLQKQVTARVRPAAIVAAVAVTALGLVGLRASWVRCRNVGEVGRRVCGMNPDWLAALLAGALAILGPISLVTFAHVMIDAMDEFTSAVQGFIRETHGIPSRSAAEQGFTSGGGSVNFRTPQEQGFA